jgi:hypothetical protein
MGFVVSADRFSTARSAWIEAERLAICRHQADARRKEASPIVDARWGLCAMCRDWGGKFSRAGKDAWLLCDVHRVKWFAKVPVSRRAALWASMKLILFGPPQCIPPTTRRAIGRAALGGRNECTQTHRPITRHHTAPRRPVCLRRCRSTSRKSAVRIVSGGSRTFKPHGIDLRRRQHRRWWPPADCSSPHTERTERTAAFR